METAQLPRAEASLTAPQSPHLNYLDGLRGFAALAVLYVHTAYHEPATSGFNVPNFFPFGRFAVCLFIVLSGFCLMTPVLRAEGVLRGGVQGFIKRRARRILPPYFLSLIFSMALILLFIGHKTGTHWDTAIPVTAKSLTAHLLLIHNVWGGANSSSQINHVYWSIAVEWQIYFLFPLLLLMWTRAGRFVSTVVSVAFASLACIAVSGTPLAGLTIQFVALFALGMLISSFAHRQTEYDRGALNGIGIAAGVSILAVAALYNTVWPQQTFSDHQLAYDLLLGVASALLITYCAVAPKSWLGRFAQSRFLVGVGAFSYSLYLVHAPLIQVFWLGIARPLSGDPWIRLSLMVVLGWPLILGCAYLFHLGCERPFMSKGSTPKQSRPIL